MRAFAACYRHSPRWHGVVGTRTTPKPRIRLIPTGELRGVPNLTFTGIYSTTVSPTPVPTSELILPPTDPFGPTDCYNFPDDFILGVAGAAAQVEGAAAMEGK
jgi:hypothetical protein